MLNKYQSYRYWWLAEPETNSNIHSQANGTDREGTKPTSRGERRCRYS